MERTTISWTFVNWLTVVLMVALMYAASGLVVSFVKGNLPQSES